MIGVDATRFRRPMDVRAVRRNQRQVQTQRLLFIAANICLALLVVVTATWIYQRTQRDRRFSIQRVETTGAMHTAKGSVDAVTAAYVGTNLFRVDVEELRRQLTRLPWVERVAIEKRLPDTLSIRLFERQPVALLSANGTLRYVDRTGASFAMLDPAVGNPELPLIVNATPADLPRVVEFLAVVRNSDATLFSRVSEIAPVEPDAFAIFDRSLRSYVLVSGAEWREKWLSVYAIADREGYNADGIEYADLRFADRIVVKPRKMPQLSMAPTTNVSAGITN